MIGRMKRKIKRLFHKHKWEKFMGLRNMGGGRLVQKYKCSKCGVIVDYSP